MDAAVFAYQDERFDEAEAAFTAAERIARDFDDSDARLAITLGNLADLHHTQGRDTQAEPLYLEALSRLERSDGGNSRLSLIHI